MRFGGAPPLETHDQILQPESYAELAKMKCVWRKKQLKLHTFNLGGAIGAYSLVVQLFHFLFLGS